MFYPNHQLFSGLKKHPISRAIPFGLRRHGSKMYQCKVDVDMLNAIKSVLADISSISPSSEQRLIIDEQKPKGLNIVNATDDSLGIGPKLYYFFILVVEKSF